MIARKLCFITGNIQTKPVTLGEFEGRVLSFLLTDLWNEIQLLSPHTHLPFTIRLDLKFSVCVIFYLFFSSFSNSFSVLCYEHGSLLYCDRIRQGDEIGAPSSSATRDMVWSLRQNAGKKDTRWETKELKQTEEATKYLMTEFVKERWLGRS